MGGSQRVIHTLAQGLGARGHRVTLIGINPSRQPQTYVTDPLVIQEKLILAEGPTESQRFGQAISAALAG